MTKLVDCPSCGGLIPAGRRCCPHCHCRYSPWRRMLLLAGAALGLAGCGGSTNVVHYGPAQGMPPPADLGHEERD